MPIWRKLFRRNCTEEEARFLLLMAFGREPSYTAELDAFMDQSFFGGLKRVLSSPFYMRTVIEPVILGKLPLVLKFEPAQQQQIAGVLQSQFDETIAPKSWTSLTRTLLSNQRFKKAFLAFYDPESLEFVSSFYEVPRPNLTRRFRAQITQTALDRVSLHLGSENGLPGSISAFVGGKSVGEIPVAAKADATTTDIDYFIDFSAAIEPQETGELSLYAEPTGQLICPPISVKNFALNSAPETDAQFPETMRYADYGKYFEPFQPGQPETHGLLPKILFIVGGSQHDLESFSTRLTPTLTKHCDAVSDGALTALDAANYDFVVPVPAGARIGGYFAHWLRWATEKAGPLAMVRFGYDQFMGAGEKRDPIFPCRFDPYKTDTTQCIGIAANGSFFQTWLNNNQPRTLSVTNIHTLMLAAYEQNGSVPVRDYIPEILMSVPMDAPSAAKGLPARFSNQILSAQASISVVIPTNGRLDLIRPCIESLQHTATYASRLNIIVIDNGPEDISLVGWLKESAGKANVMVVRDNRAFNWSALNNLGAAHSSDEILVFLNDDTEAISQGWDDQIRSLLATNDVGVVGAKLLYPSGSIQHAGILLSHDLKVMHEGKGLPDGTKGYTSRYVSSRACDAVTGAFLACRRSDFEEMGGFDEELAVTFNDIEFCIRLKERGLNSVYNPEICFYHYESESRGLDDGGEKSQRKSEEHQYFCHKHQEFIADQNRKFGAIAPDIFTLDEASDFTILKVPAPNDQN